MATESLAALTNISGEMFAGGAVAFGVAALVLTFIRRTKRQTLTHVDVIDKKAWTPREIYEGLCDARERGRKDKKATTETYVRPVDIWVPTDLERGLETIPGPPTVLEELRMVQDVETKLEDPEREIDEISATSSAGPFICTFPGCTKSYPRKYELNHHTRYHDRSEACPNCHSSFATTKDLNRHINSVHQTTKKYHCTVLGCKYSKISAGGTGGASFARKDNWRRHMRQHGKGDEDMEIDE